MLELREKIANGLERTWLINRVLAHKHTEYQEVLIAQTAQGITLFCDNERQSSELSQLIYHECQIVPAMLATKGRGRALVIGSSEGVVSLILLEEGFEHIDHVDIDQQCVNMCASLLPYGYAQGKIKKDSLGDYAYNGGPIYLYFEDGYEFVKKTENKYDIICMDLPDLSSEGGNSPDLYAEDFLASCRDHLTEGGVFITQAGCASAWRQEGLREMYKRMSSVFKEIEFYDSDEQDWCWLLGVHDPESRLVTSFLRLETLKYQPRHMTDGTLSKMRIAPHGVLH